MLKKNIVFRDQSIFPFKSLGIFNIVIDIEKYPEFLPWCHTINIISRDESSIYANSIIKFKSTTVEYQSEISFRAPSIGHSGYINVQAHEGTFKHLFNTWQFINKQHNHTLVKFDIECEFKSTLMHYSMHLVYRKAQQKIITAFKNRMYSRLR